jgi:uncharacterized protein (TIGR03435 family)
MARNHRCYDTLRSFIKSVRTRADGDDVAAPFVDKTGLTAKYDFVLRSLDEAPPTSPDPTFCDFEHLGLEMKPVKVPTETLFIDHIEPSSGLPLTKLSLTKPSARDSEFGAMCSGSG